MKTAFSAIDAVDWFRAEAETNRLKVLSGIRGGGKSAVVAMYREDLVNRGVLPEDIIHLDFESAALRSVKDHRAVMKEIINQRGGRTGRSYLILDEITTLLDFEFLMALLYSHAEYDVMLTTSNSRLLTDEVVGYFENRVSECRLYPGFGLYRTSDKLSGIWAEVFLKDVLGGHVLADATATERLAGYISDHLGEEMSRRQIALDFKVGTCQISANTISDYLDLLIGAYLVEAVSVYDTFTCEVPRNAGRRFFWTDPVLRAHRFGNAPEDAEERIAYNAKYLDLKRRFGRVACVRSQEKFSDFVIFRKNCSLEVIKWKKS